MRPTAMRADATDLTEHLLRLAARAPQAPALTAPGHAPMSFGALAAQIARVRAALAALGIERGDVVAWRTGDRQQTAAALASMPASSTLAPLGTHATGEFARTLFARLRPKALVVPPEGDAGLERAAREHGIAILVPTPAGEGAGAFDLALQEPAASLDRDARLDPGQALIGATSGSTGRPKLVPHGHRQILRTAWAAGERTGMGPGDAAGHVMPMHLAGGIRSAFFQTLCAGGAVCCLPEADVAALLEAIAAGEVTYASASFTMQREMLRRLEARALPTRGRLRFIRVASGRLDADEMDRLEQALGARVVTGLASSEVGTIAQQDPLRPRKRGVVGPPLDCELRIVDEQGRAVPPGEAGEIQVRGPQLFDGYVDDDALNAAAFVDGWFRMGDVGRLDADGDLEVVGRVKDVINRGGDKIAPLEIDAVMASLPGVAEAAAFGVPHARLGEEVVAAVVPAAGATLDAVALLEAVRMRLGARRSPRRLYVVDRLPRTELGKLRRGDLPAWVGYEPDAVAADLPAPGTPAVSPLERALTALWSVALARDDVARDLAFHAQGGDDERARRLCAQVADAFGVALPVAELRDGAATIAAMARYIERARASV